MLEQERKAHKESLQVREQEVRDCQRMLNEYRVECERAKAELGSAREEASCAR